MDLYKTALSALLIAPIVGGISVQMIHGYERTKEQAEQYVSSTQKQIEEIEQYLAEDGELGEYGKELGLSEQMFLNVDSMEEEDALMPVIAQNQSQSMGIGFDDSEDQNVYTDAGTLYDDVRNAVIRFHIRANSDQTEDQRLKLKVRDAVLHELESKLKKAKNLQDAKKIIERNLDDIQETAEKVVEEEGYNYPVTAYLTKEEFPIKAYGDLLFPSGEYEALRIDIGEHEGGNWWCVMYPGLCFVDTVGGVVSEDGKELLSQTLTTEEYEELIICPKEDTTIQYRSLLWEYLKEVF